MNRADLDHLLERVAQRLAGESDGAAQQLSAEIESARNILGWSCSCRVALMLLSDYAREGRHMSRVDDPDVIAAWQNADSALEKPCVPVRMLSADLAYQHVAVAPSVEWINGRRPFQTKDGDVIQVWRPGRVDGEAIPTLSQRILNLTYAAAEIRAGWPLDEIRAQQQLPPIGPQLDRFCHALDQLEVLERELREKSL